MRVSLIICTYNRHADLRRCLSSVLSQTVVPAEIIIVDSSDKEIQDEYADNKLIKYFHVTGEDCGLTRQRNRGLYEISRDSDIVSFIDDDVVLCDDYFEKIIGTFYKNPTCSGIGGVDLQTNAFVPINENESNFNEVIDGWGRVWPKRYKARLALGLISPTDRPGQNTSYMHARDMLPPSGFVYSVDHLVGCSMNYRTKDLGSQLFDEFFHGYGLYEDFDFSYRCKEAGGELLIDTNARFHHYHSPNGRPNRFKYGRMVIRNGRYIWKRVNTTPTRGDRVKWYSINMLNIIFPIMSSRTILDFSQNISDAFGRIYELILPTGK